MFYDDTGNNLDLTTLKVFFSEKRTFGRRRRIDNHDIFTIFF